MNAFCKLAGLAALGLASACTTNVLGNLEAEELGDLTFGEPERARYDAALDAACASTGGPTSLGVERFFRLPYLQQVTRRSAELLWTAADSASVAIEPAEGAAAALVPLAAAIDPGAPLPEGAQYQVSAGELSAGSIFCYQVHGDDGPWTELTGFRTAPRPGEPVRLAALGDLGKATPDQQALLEQLAELPIQATLLTGDLAYDSGTLPEFEAHFFAVYGELLAKIPFFPASGNHDIKSDDGAAFRQVFSLFDSGSDAGRERWYSFDWGDVHVAALDTEKVGPEQAAWLEADLAASDAPWKLVILHKPAYSSGKHGDTASVKEHFLPLFERHRVHLVLAGHDHNYERFHPIRGVTHVVTGGGGVGTRSVGSSPETAFAAEVIHFVYLEANGDTLTGWATDATGQVFDTFRIEGPHS
jgi:3',5'-cyclic AMP phosphodiesterase CpdA